MALHVTTARAQRNAPPQVSGTLGLLGIGQGAHLHAGSIGGIEIVMNRQNLIAAVVLAVSMSSDTGAQDADLLAAREAFAVALEQGDKEAYKSLLADDLTWVDRGGRLRNKQLEVAEFEQRPRSTSQPDVSVYGRSAVLVGRRQTDDNSNGVVNIQVWERATTGWIMLAIQNTQIGGNPTNTDSRPSASLAPNIGARDDLNAIASVAEQIQRGNRRKDPASFRRLTTDQFVSVSAAGQVHTKSEHAAEILSSGSGGDDELIRRAQSTRVHSDIAITNSILQNAAGLQFRRMGVSVRQQGQWLIAGEITTAVASSTRGRAAGAK